MEGDREMDADYIKNRIENEFNNWMNVVVTNIETVLNNYKVHLIDSDGYKYCATYDVIKTSVRRKAQLHRFFRNNIYTLENIKNYLILNNKDFTLISNNINTATEKVSWNCPIHGEFLNSWNCIKNGHGCPICGRIKQAESKRNSFEYVKTKFEEYNMELISTEYKNNEDGLLFICNKHRDAGIQKMSFGQLITKKRCSLCGKESQIQNQTKSHENFIKEVHQIHGDKYVVKGNYINCKTHIAIYCTECDCEFPITPSHLLEGHGCPNCNISRGEERIKVIFLDNSVEFQQQYKFEDCRHKRLLPFDFAVFKNDQLYCLIEYQGIQHYKPVEKFGGQKQLESQQYIDNIKRNYCREHSIKLIEIPYNQYKNIGKILHKENII